MSFQVYRENDTDDVVYTMKHGKLYVQVLHWTVVNGKKWPVATAKPRLVTVQK